MSTLSARERISYAIRMTVSHALYYSGILHLFLRVKLRDKTVVLAYHRVLTKAQRERTGSHEALVVEEETFARQIGALTRLFRVLTLDEFAEHLAKRLPFRGPCCLITFDDGWVDNFDNAWPVLRAHKLPAVMFLPVNFIGGGRLFTREALTHLLVRAVAVCRREPARSSAFAALLSPLGFDRVLALADDDPLPAILAQVSAHRYADGPEFEALVAALATELNVSDLELSNLDTFVDWSKVEILGRDGFAFGGHGADHRVLTKVAPAVVKCEVESSKRVLDRRLANGVYAFAYPNGGWNADIARTVKAAGYRLSFTIDQGHVSCDDDHFALHRVNIHEGMTRSTPMFMARLAGIF